MSPRTVRTSFRWRPDTLARLRRWAHDRELTLTEAVHRLVDERLPPSSTIADALIRVTEEQRGGERNEPPIMG